MFHWAISCRDRTENANTKLESLPYVFLACSACAMTGMSTGYFYLSTTRHVSESFATPGAMLWVPWTKTGYNTQRSVSCVSMPRKLLCTLLLCSFFFNVPIIICVCTYLLEILVIHVVQTLQTQNKTSETSVQALQHIMENIVICFCYLIFLWKKYQISVFFVGNICE